MRIKRIDLKSTEVQKSMRKKQPAKRKEFTDSHSEKEGGRLESCNCDLQLLLLGFGYFVFLYTNDYVVTHE